MSDNQTAPSAFDGLTFFSFAMAAQRNGDNIAQPHPDLRQPGLISESTCILHGDAADDWERRIVTARVDHFVRMSYAIERARARQVPASGDSGFRGSVDDPICPPTLYEWMMLMIHAEAHRWEATTAVKPRCLFCNVRHAELDLHVDKVHGGKWRQAILTHSGLTSQDMIGIYFYMVVTSDSWSPGLTEEEEAAVRNLFEAHNHLSFVQPGNSFPITYDRYIPLFKLALEWAMGPPLR